jgi:hypothetical protein
MCWRGCRQRSPKPGETLTKNHGAKAGETLLARLRDQLDQRGTLDVLRHGIELLGLKTPLQQPGGHDLQPVDENDSRFHARSGPPR